MAVEFRILGPIEVDVDGRPLRLPDRRQTRLLLGLLLLEVGRPVSVGRLCELLWPADLPANARAGLQSTVSRLRATIPNITVIRKGEAYLLDTDPDCVDLHRFRRLLEEAGRAVEPLARRDLARRALSLWRGPALANVATDAVHDLASGVLDEERQRALDIRIAADLDLGRHHELIGELTELVAAYPLNERLVIHLVLALYRSGRRGDALGTCRRARETLVEHLGLDPSSTLEQLEVSVLRGDPTLAAPATAADGGEGTPSSVPAQLPGAAIDLFGRTVELGRLDELLDAAAERNVAGIAVVTGAPGVGKTSLAVRWGHDVVGRFPDGQLYLNLHGFGSDEPVRPMAALAGCLTSLGVEPDAIPGDQDQAAAALRTRLAGRRVLVVLDNAANVEQVRPLLPGAPGCFTLVTSRDSLSGLIARDGATAINLLPLTDVDASTLLADMVGAGRVGDDPEAAQRLVRACGGLPLALRIVGAQLLDSPHRTVSDHLQRMVAAPPLDALQLADDPNSAVRVAFDHSYLVLDDETRLIFRSLGVVALPGYAPQLIGAIAGTTESIAVERLERLRRGSLVELGPRGRYVVHDLLHQYAHEHATAGDPTAVAAAEHRLYDHQLRRVVAAANVLYPQLMLLSAPAETVTSDAFDSRAAAMEWLEAEIDGLVTLVLHAADRGHAEAAYRLADALRGYFWLSWLTVSWFTVAEAGLRAATAVRHPQGQCSALLSFGLAYLSTSRYEAAAASFAEALTRGREAGWPAGEASALGGLGTASMALGNLDNAATWYRQAMRLNRQLGSEAGMASNRGNLGLVLHRWGRLDEAADEFTAAIGLQRKNNQLASVALNLQSLARVERDLGRYPQAEEHVREALRLTSEAGNTWAEAVAHAWLGSIYRDLDDLEAAEHELTYAIDRLGSLDPTWECDVQHTLASIWLARGDHHLALAAQQRADELAVQVADRYQIVETGIGLAEVRLALADTAAATTHANAALDAAVELGYRQHEGCARTVLAAIALLEGRPVEAHQHAAAALDLHRLTGYRLGTARAATLMEQSAR